MDNIEKSRNRSTNPKFTPEFKVKITINVQTNFSIPDRTSPFVK